MQGRVPSRWNTTRVFPTAGVKFSDLPEVGLVEGQSLTETIRLSCLVVERSEAFSL